MWITEPFGPRTVEKYTVDELVCEMYNNDHENVEGTVDNIVSAFGRLLDNLADRGLLQEVDLKFIVEDVVFTQDDDFKFKKG